MDAREKLKQLREEFAIRAKLQEQYKAEMKDKYPRDQVKFSEWLQSRGGYPQVEQKSGGGIVSPEEREENLRRFLDPSSIKDRLYHGTYSWSKNGKQLGDVREFNRNASVEISGRKPSIDTVGSWMSTNPGKGGAEMYGNTIYPLHAQIKNPYRTTFDKMLQRARLLENGKDDGRVVGESEVNALRTWLKETGRDGIHIKHDPKSSSTEFKDQDAWIALEPNQIKSAIGNRGTYDTKHKDITKAKGGSVPQLADGGQPSLDQMRLELTKQKMYSPLEKAALAVPRTKGTPAEFMTEASKQPGFRKEEVEDRRIALPQQKMTKPEFIQHLKKHPMPLLDVAEMGEQAERDFHKEKRELAEYLTHYDRTPEEAHDEAHDQLREKLGYDPSETSYGEYQLPGGENYREVLLKTPRKGLTDAERKKMMWIEANKSRGDISPALEQMLEHLKAKEAAGAQDYDSSHWKGHPNVLAHLRLSDRRGPNGEKLLHVEEVQSDWHQEARQMREKEIKRLMAEKGLSKKDASALVSEEFGYNKPETSRIPGKVVDAGDGTYRVEWADGTFSGGYNWASAMEKAEQGKSNAKPGVPNAPHKKSWHELAMKHVLGEAARKGYHGIVITPGEEQAKRYDLSKQVDRVEYFPESNNLVAMKGGHPVIAHTVPPEKLDDYVGKEAAKKLLSQPLSPAKRIGESGGMHLLEGQDLQVGGEGMKGFYDKIIPDYLNKLGKPHGAKVGSINLDTAGNNPPSISFYPNGEHSVEYQGQSQDFPSLEEAQNHAKNLTKKRVHHFPITDSLRKQILTEGLPQYVDGGTVQSLSHDVSGENMQPTMAQMKMALAKKANPVDLKNIGAQEAPGMTPKMFISPDRGAGIKIPPPGGVAMPNGAAIGGVDANPQQLGQQMMAGQQPGQQSGQPPQGVGAPPSGPTPPQGNLLQMTPQGQAMAAMGGGQQPQQQPQGLSGGGQPDEDYRGSHEAPGPHFGAPMHDVARDMYPKDFYGPNGFRYYADQGEQKDRVAYNKVTRVKGKPNEMVSIYRAIPTSVYKEALKKEAPLKHMIRKGDWVAIHRDYAKEHGDSVLRGDYKIAAMRVPAKHVWTNADSIHEWGYHPEDKTQKLAKGGKVFFANNMDTMHHELTMKKKAK